MCNFNKIFFNKINFPTPVNVNIFWNLGSFILLIFIIQVVSGFLLSTSFSISYQSPLKAKTFILNEFDLGWMLVKFHLISSTILFNLLLLHIFRSIFFNISVSVISWFSGFLLLIVFIVNSFIGYCVSGGIMSSWGLAIGFGISRSLLGEYITGFIFYDSSIGASNLTTIKFFTYHISLSYFTMVLILFHIMVIHSHVSSTSLLSSFYDLQRFSLVRLVCDLEFNLFFLFIYLILISFGIVDNSGEGFRDGSGRIPKSVELYNFVRIMFLVLKSIDNKFLGILISNFLFFTLLFYFVFSTNLFGFNNFSFLFIFVFSSFFVYFMMYSNYFFVSFSYFIPTFLLIFVLIFCINFLFN